MCCYYSTTIYVKKLKYCRVKIINLSFSLMILISNVLVALCNDMPSINSSAGVPPRLKCSFILFTFRYSTPALPCLTTSSSLYGCFPSIHTLLTVILQKDCRQMCFGMLSSVVNMFIKIFTFVVHNPLSKALHMSEKFLMIYTTFREEFSSYVHNICAAVKLLIRVICSHIH